MRDERAGNGREKVEYEFIERCVATVIVVGNWSWERRILKICLEFGGCVKREFT